MNSKLATPLKANDVFDGTNIVTGISRTRRKTMSDILRDYLLGLNSVILLLV